MSRFLCLGIETSCDETAAAVVADGVDPLSSVVLTQERLHEKFGGVVPEIASRAHIEGILPAVDTALRRAGVSLTELSAIAVTYTPGLIGALLVGVSAAKALALASGKPLIGVDHIQAHLYAARMGVPDFRWPAVSLLVSGGHTSLYESRGDLDHRFLGGTRDDAVGEAFDKASKALGLGYPGGPAIERAAQGRDPNRFRFARTMIDEAHFDFSFSGIKTSVLYAMHGQDARGRAVPRTPEEVADIAAGFQEAVVDVLVAKSVRACLRLGIPRLVVGGGVARNGRLRQRMAEACAAGHIELFFPPPELCTDNAVMVAGLAWPMFQAGLQADLDLDAVATKQHRR